MNEEKLKKTINKNLDMIDSIKDFFDGIQEYHESLIKDSNDPKVIKNNFDKFTTDELKKK